MPVRQGSQEEQRSSTYCAVNAAQQGMAIDLKVDIAMGAEIFGIVK